MKRCFWAAVLLLALLCGCGEAPAAVETVEATPVAAEPEAPRFVELGGKEVSVDAEEYVATAVSVEELLAAAPQFTALRLLDVSGCDFDNEALLRLREALPETEIKANISLYGQSFDTTVTELDFSGTPLENAEELEAMLPLLPGLEKVIMSDCGLSNEDMDALNKRHEDVRFVWTVYFGHSYYLRTDETSFIGSIFQGNRANYCGLTNEDVEVLKYCVDMEALDLGHMPFSDCSFVSYMPKLRYLIMADTNVDDLTPLAGLQELWYLEIFDCNITAIAPLLECPSLRHLNICYTDIHDEALLEQMVDLERLWYLSPAVSNADYHWLMSILPNTEKVIGISGNSTHGGWRQHEAYFAMRDALGAYYMY